MKMVRRLTSKIQYFLRRQSQARQLRNISSYQKKYDIEKSFPDILALYSDRNLLYTYMHHHFHNLCPEYIREHRSYFKQDKRGFGEDAFHAMWYLLLRYYNPRKCLEIGVYRGQIISLWSLISKSCGFTTEIHGISPFTPVGDDVSSYVCGIDYYSDILASFKRFNLPTPMLLKALSTDDEAKSYVAEKKWDLIYIDGSHDYKIVLADYLLCKEHLSPKGILVVDDASLGSDFRPPWFSFSGHAGPSRVAREYADKEMEFICAVGHNNIYRRV